MFAVTVLSVAILAGQASAAFVAARHPFAGFIQARQSSGSGIDPSEIPTQCQNDCLTTLSVINGNTCTDISCLCSSTVNTGFQACLNCILQVEGDDSDDASQAQGALAQYEDACAQAGVPLSSLSISGATGVVTASTSVGSVGTSTQSQSVFFSSPGATGLSTIVSSLPSSSGSFVASPTISHTTITALPSTAIGASTIAPNPTSSSTSGSGSSNKGPLASGAESLASVSKMAIVGVAAGVIALLGF